MKKIIPVVIAIIIIVIGFAFALKFNIIPKKQYGPYDDFVFCLKGSDTKIYGDYTDVNSLRQLSLFGDSLYTLEKSGVYLECNQYGPNPKVNKCIDAGLTVYPTWIIKDKKYPGVYGLNKISEITGCKYGN